MNVGRGSLKYGLERLKKILFQSLSSEKTDYADVSSGLLPGLWYLHPQRCSPQLAGTIAGWIDIGGCNEALTLLTEHESSKAGGGPFWPLVCIPRYLNA